MDALFATLYHELHRLAAHHVRAVRPGESLGTTTLLHEAYLNLKDHDPERFADRHRFLGYASRAMRGLVIDYARRRRAKKRGGEYQLLGDEAAAGEAAGESGQDEGIERLAAAMEQLEGVDATAAQLIDLHVFCGMSLVEISHMRAVSERTIQRDWRKARLLLRHLVTEQS